MNKSEVKYLVLSAIFFFFLLGILEAQTPVTHEIHQQSLVTSFSLQVGFPHPGESTMNGVLIVPGVIIPTDNNIQTTSEQTTKYVREHSEILQSISERLQDTLRLDRVVTQYDIMKTLYLDEPVTLESPHPDSKVAITVTLIGFNDSLATYNIKFTEGYKILVDTSVNIQRDRRSIIGGIDGEQAPYFFLIVEPLEFDPLDFDMDAGMTKPVLVDFVQPIYPEECKKNGIQGNVVVRGIIDKDGVIHDITVLQSPDNRLAESAIAAVRQWRFKPAYLNDKPLSVYYALTVRFNLGNKKKE